MTWGQAPENRGPSNQPGHYDKARVAQLRPIEEAVKKLALPLVRFRKIAVLLRAIEMQIENGGDSPEVNGLLLASLRAAVRHQVDDRQAQPTLRAIDGFEKAEAERWAQVRAGTLPPMARSAAEQLNDLMKEGYKLLKARQTAAACDRWLAAWELVKQLARPEMRTTDEFDKACRDLSQFVFNWCQDFEMELGNAAVDNPVYNEHRLRYASELLAHFPDEKPGFYVNFMRAQGEALWNLGRRAEAEAVFAALVERVPDDAWAYIGWADQYWLFNHSPQEYAKAEAILKRGLAQPSVNDRACLIERMEELYGRWGKPVEQAAIATEQEQPKAKAKTSQRSLLGRIGSLWQPDNAPPPVSAPVKNPPTAAAKGPARAAVKKAAPAVPPAKKPGRNEPCWCGSGKKYKRCHLETDAATGR